MNDFRNGVHMMIDLETLGRDPQAVIVSFGACFFDSSGIYEDKSLEANLNAQEQIDYGRTVENDTLAWWMDQNSEAQADAFKPRSTMYLETFFPWLSKAVLALGIEKLNVWGNGGDFDLALMSSLHRTASKELKHWTLELPWTYPNQRCYKTFRHMTGCNKMVKREGTHHNALSDAIHQAKCMIEYWNRN